MSKLIFNTKLLSKTPKVTDTYFTTPVTQGETTTVVSEVKPVKYDGIGPVTEDGVPLANRKVSGNLFVVVVDYMNLMTFFFFL